MIDAWLILRALFWQAVGGGMLVKGAIDRGKANMTSFARMQAYAPVKEFWEKYGMSAADSNAFLREYREYGETCHRVKKELRDKLDESLYNELYPHKEWTDGQAACVLYWATYGRAMRFSSGSFPESGTYRINEKYRKAAERLLRESGVKEAEWYGMTEREIRDKIGIPYGLPF